MYYRYGHGFCPVEISTGHVRIWTRVQDIDIDRLKLWVLRFSSVTAPPPEMFG